MGELKYNKQEKSGQYAIEREQKTHLCKPLSPVFSRDREDGLHFIIPTGGMEYPWRF